METTTIDLRRMLVCVTHEANNAKVAAVVEAMRMMMVRDSSKNIQKATRLERYAML
jgi:hypothetical protein